MENILLALFYVAALVVLILHFTGWLEDNELEWIVFLTAGLAFVYPVISIL